MHRPPAPPAAAEAARVQAIHRPPAHPAVYHRRHGQWASGEDSDGPASGGACCRDADRVTAGDTGSRGCVDEVGCGGAATAASAGGRSCLATLVASA